MPECRNCGNHVSKEYVRVFAPNGAGTVECCPDCEDKTRENGLPKDKRQ